MLKNYNYILTIILYPFIVILSYLKLTNVLKSNLYTYLILIMIVIFIPSFIMSLYSASEEILHSNKKYRIIFLILLSMFYLPIYYTKYVYKSEKYLGYLLFVIIVPLTLLTVNAFNRKLLMTINNLYRNYVVIDENYVYYSRNKLFSINVDKSFRCNRDDIGDYVISCDRMEDDSFIGIYSYDITLEEDEEKDEKLDFHFNQTIEYIEEMEYEYEVNINDDVIEINYNENTILITERDYLVGENNYCLIIIKEMPKEYVSYLEYQKMIDSIYFLNYNDGVSS